MKGHSIKYRVLISLFQELTKLEKILLENAEQSKVAA